MTGQFGLEAYSGPLDHDDGSDEFIIDQYRSQIDKSPPPPKVLLFTATELETESVATERAILDQIKVFEALYAGQMHKPREIKKNFEWVDRIARKKPAESDNSRKQGDTASMNDINREELDAKLSAVEARMDRRIADFQGDIRQAVSDFRLEIQPIKGMKANIWSATAVMVGTIVAVVGLSFTAFDSGREASELVQEAKQQSVETRKLLEQIQAQQKSLSVPVQAPPAPPTSTK